MKISSNARDELRNIIIGDNTTKPRTGRELVKFFNELGFHDRYESGITSKGKYTDEKLQRLNGTADMDKCIRNTFAVVNFIDRISELDALIKKYNQYLAFDKWQVVRDNEIITFKHVDRVIIDSPTKALDEIKEADFLSLVFCVNVDDLGLDAAVGEIIKLRLKEAEACIRSDAPLASIILIGSILEGVLLGVALLYPKQFNKTSAAPKERDSDKIKKFQDWTLNNFIDAAFEIGLIKLDVKKFSHTVRDFRNYIHPYEQMGAHFYPDGHTARICFQVLQAAISQIAEYKKAN